jgi:hypothetical protein
LAMPTQTACAPDPTTVSATSDAMDRCKRRMDCTSDMGQLIRVPAGLAHKAYNTSNETWHSTIARWYDLGRGDAQLSLYLCLLLFRASMSGLAKFPALGDYPSAVVLGSTLSYYLALTVSSCYELGHVFGISLQPCWLVSFLPFSSCLVFPCQLSRRSSLDGHFFPPCLIRHVYIVVSKHVVWSFFGSHVSILKKIPLILLSQSLSAHCMAAVILPIPTSIPDAGPKFG